MKNLVKESVAKLKPYVPGFQPKDSSYIKLNTNENPFGPSPLVFESIKKELSENLRLYPDPVCSELREKVAELYGVSYEMVVFGNGSDEILSLIMKAFVEKGERVCAYTPCYSLYKVLCAIYEAEFLPIPYGSSFSLSCPDVFAKLIFLTNPNSPFGFCVKKEEVFRVLRRFPGLFVVDEAYGDFWGDTFIDFVKEFPNIFIVRTLSKSYSLASLRVGFGIGNKKIVEAIDKVRDSYNVNRISQVAAFAALCDQEYKNECIRRIVEVRDWFVSEIEKLGFYVYPSQANFVFVVPPDGFSAKEIYKKLFEKKIIVRFFEEEGIDHGLRISVGKKEEMEILLSSLREILDGHSV